jgi:ribosome-associated toxin RatA of RatAB toxin-antitoxin module
MERVAKSILIQTPVDTIFDFVSAPANLLKIWPGMIELQDVQQLHNGDLRFQCVHKMVGARIESTWETVQYVVNRHITIHISGGFRSAVTWTFQPQNDGTMVTFNMEYAIPAPLLRKHSKASIIAWNEHEADNILANLKAEMEPCLAR